VDDDITRSAGSGLTEEHAEFLRAAAIDVDLARGLGVHSLLTPQDAAALGDSNWERFANFPALVFPWRNEEGEVRYQARPDNPTTDQKTGKPRKYVFARSAGSVLWAVRPVPTAERIVIIEGTKQVLAGASHAPPGIGIYGIAGIRNWQVDGHAIPDLGVVDGREVILIPDADAGNNPQVFDACMELAKALSMEGASKILFGRLPGGASKSGLDDILAGRPAGRRDIYFARILADAKPKPADKRPTLRRKTAQMPTAEGRSTLVCNRDRLLVINDLTQVLLDRLNATRLFNHGGVISQMIEGGTMSPVEKGAFNDLVAETAVTVNENDGAQGVTYSFAWPDAGTMSATLSRSAQFATLDRVAHAPFARPDGTIATEPGYDEATRTILIPDGELAGLAVPEDPSPDEIIAARELLLTEWLGDFPLDGEADKANLLALIVTPAIRGMIPRAPLAVIDGIQMGVGKNLMADSILTVYTGHAAQPMNWVSEPEELRKQITSAFRTGQEFFVFDEAHTLEGAPLAQALTAETWQDRILGVSTMANFPNRVTWLSLGNNVQVKGDITRRVYRIALRPRYANPQDRAASSFRHPGQSGLDLLSWTRKHRRDLLTAVLTLTRAWFAAGAPHPKTGVSFGSFEAWERTVGGIVETAGLPGFLGNLKIWRSESDFDTQYWLSHLMWLQEQFAGKPFKTGQVKEKALTVGTDLYAAPPRLDDPTEKTYGKSLGEAYSRLRGRRYGDLWIERVSSSHGHVALWEVHQEEELPPPPAEEDPPWDPDPAPDNEHGEARGPDESDTTGGAEEVRPPVGPDTQVSTSVQRLGDTSMDELVLLGELDTQSVDNSGETPVAELVTFDLETGDAAEIYRRGPGYVRIGATAQDDQPVQEYGQSVPRWVAAEIQQGGTITGHNIMAFDLPALVREGAMTMEEIHRLASEGRVFDAILAARYLDPPMAKETGVDAQRKYDLGALGRKYDLGAKLTDVSKALAKKYGGWDHIPIDDSENGLAFRRYMVQDVELSRGLYHRLIEELDGTVPDYLKREHRVAALATQISMNGFLVDQPLLAERITEIEARKVKAMEVLTGRYGVPTVNAKGVEYKAPLSSAAGKEAIGAALVAAGIPEKALWRTAKAKDLQISSDSMIHYGQEYGHIPAVAEVVKNVYQIVSARTVYETIHNNLGPDGRVHPKISFEQATGRWSVTSPGLTVLGKRGGRHVERAVLLPDPGEVLVAFDLSQVDMRALAGLSQDPAYIQMLLSEDPHAELAELLLADRGKRETAKPIGHGWNYGRGVKAIAQSNDLDPAIVWKFDQAMRERFPRLVEWQAEVRTLAESGALLDNGFGRLMRPDPRRAYTQGPALMGQGCARDLMMEGMLRLPAETLPMLRAQIHDEIILSIPAGQVREVSEAVVDALSFEWRGVPILADSSPAGSSWAACYEKG
jgi:hypothetical protein